MPSEQSRMSVDELLGQAAGFLKKYYGYDTFRPYRPRLSGLLWKGKIRWYLCLPEAGSPFAINYLHYCYRERSL